MPDADEPRRTGPEPGDRLPVQVEAAYVEEPSRVSVVHLVNILLRNRRVVLGLPAALALLAVLSGLVLPRSYTVSAAFISQGSDQASARLSGLASQFGLVLPIPETGESPAFYARLVTSEDLLRSAVRTPYRRAAPGETGEPLTLEEFYRVGGRDSARRVEETVDELRDAISVNVDGETGVVDFAVRTRDPDVSEQVVARLLELVDDYNSRIRRSQAVAEREFVEARLLGARAELRAAEDTLLVFLRENRRIDNSPELTFEQDRLQRRVSLRQQVYDNLFQSYEQSRIDEVRDTPVITVVERPLRPVRPDPRHLPRLAAIGVLLGGLLAVFVAAGREYLRAARERKPEDYLEFVQLRRRTADDVRAAWRRVRRPGRDARGG